MQQYVRAIVVWGLVSGAAEAQEINFKYTKEYIERIRLASEVPVPIDAFQYKITGTYEGVNYYPNGVPLFRDAEGLVQVDTLAEGAAIQLDYLRMVGGRNFFGFKRPVKLEGGQEVEQVVWVDGRFIVIANAP